MSISSAFSIARSGLGVTEGRASLVAGNIANSQTDGYVRRDGVQVTTGGAEVNTIELRVSRQVDERLANLSRSASAELGQAAVAGEILGGYLLTLGQPGDEVSPAARLAEFQTGLDLLSNNPANAAAQNDVLARARMLTHSLNAASNALQGSSQQAGDSLEVSVAEMNGALTTIAQLNEKLRAADAEGAAVSGLMDEMNRRLDALGAEMNFSSRWESDGSLSLFTTGGTALLTGGDAVTLTADRDTGALFADGVDITPGQAGLRGSDSGRLAGLSRIISAELPQMQLQLDELARSLVQGFEAADASRAPGQAGLFTDAGGPFDAAQLDGLAGRLAINDSVNPEAGGALWRLRDGAGATAPGEAGDTTQINAFIDVFETVQAYDPDAGLNSADTLGAFAANLVGHQNNVKVTADARAQTAGIRLVTFEDSRSSMEGVNVDTELQKLLEIEQAYGANSQVLSSLVEMLDTLLNSV